MTPPPNSGGKAAGSVTEAGPAADPGSDFIRAKILADRAAGKHGGRVHTRFPPEPNGYLHIGHAKSICLNFGVAAELGGLCNLRFDDTNPTTEDPEYVAAIEDDVRWLGFDWDDRLFYASDYFERLYVLGEKLIEDGKAYVDELSEDEIRAYRGTVTEPGRPSPWRDRPAAESLALFRRMRAGELAAGAAVLRARIDMAAANMKMRDPLLYRIRHAEHYRTGDDWPIYPMYDFAHPLSDAFEGITHSLCTLEFENNREIYDWLVRETAAHRRPEHTPEQTPPEQIEFARLNLTYTVLSKRKLKELVDGGHVEGWDDPRMPTLAGLRRRGFTPAAIRDFCDRIGVAKSNSTVDVAQLEHSVRDDLNTRAPRVLCVLRPLRVTITNYPQGDGPEDPPEEPPEDQIEELDAPYWPHDVPRDGSRPLPFGRTLFIDEDDFADEPPPGWRRLAPGWEVRLRYAYFIRCDEVVRDASGRVVELLCTYDPATRGGSAPDGRKPKGTLHWVSAERSLPVEVRLYDRLFAEEKPGETKEADFLAALNPSSLEVLTGARLEESAAGAAPGSRFQFERQGYFYLDPASASGRPVFNRIVALRDTWSKPAASPPSASPRKAAAETAVELPAEARPELTPELLRYRAVLGLPPTTAAALAADAELAGFFERTLAVRPEAAPPPAVESVAGWVVNDVQRARKERAAAVAGAAASGAEPGLAGLPFGPAEVAELAALVDSGRVTATAGREVFAELAEGGGSPAAIVSRRGLEKLDDPAALAAAVDTALAEHAAEVAAYRAGKTQLLGFFIGRVMAATGGAADASAVRRLLTERL